MLRLRNKTLLICPWGGFGLPKGGDGFISSPFGPVIPRRVALQQSQFLFGRTAESEGQDSRDQASVVSWVSGRAGREVGFALGLQLQQKQSGDQKIVWFSHVSGDGTCFVS